MFKQFTLAIGLMLSFGPLHAAVVWDWDAVTNTLHGAQNVDVGGSLYDVAFVDGSCVGLFGGCDDAGDFDFATTQAAITASRALLDQVFINSGAPALFDTTPSLANGCESSWTESGGPGGGPVDQCLVVTPTLDAFLLFGNNAHAINNDTLSDGWGVVTIQASEDFSGSDSERAARFTYADWTVSAVPVPAAVWLFGSALLGLFGFGKLRKHAQA